MTKHSNYDYWDSDPDYPDYDWIYEVRNGDTRLGYWEWVGTKRQEHVNEIDKEG